MVSNNLFDIADFRKLKRVQKGPTPSPSPKLAKSGNLIIFIKKFKFNKAAQAENKNRLKEIIKYKI